MDGVLGISPSTRTFGLVIFTHGSLADWQIKSFLGKWSDDKLCAILSCLEHYLNRFDIEAVVCKVYDKQGLKQEVMKGIRKLCKRLKVPFHCFSLKEIVQATVVSKKKNTKQGIMEFLIKRYPELMIEFTQELHNLNPYYIKVFEAIGAVEALFKSQGILL